MTELEAVARALCRASILEHVRTAALPEELPEDALQEEIDYRWREFVDHARIVISLREMSAVTVTCLRIMAERGLAAELQAALARLGIKDGFGVRAREALEGVNHDR